MLFLTQADYSLCYMQAVSTRGFNTWYSKDRFWVEYYFKFHKIENSREFYPTEKCSDAFMQH